MAVKPAEKITITEIISRMNDAVEHLRGGNYNSRGDALAEARDELARGNWVKADDLMGVADLAAFFDIGATTVSGWYMHRERGMPDPVAYISNKIPCWDGAAVVSWWINWVPRKGAKAGTLPWERERAERRARGEAV